MSSYLLSQQRPLDVITLLSLTGRLQRNSITLLPRGRTPVRIKVRFRVSDGVSWTQRTVRGGWDPKPSWRLPVLGTETQTLCRMSGDEEKNVGEID